MSAWRWLGLGVVGVLAYVLFLAATVPASVVWSRLSGDGPVRAYGIQGTLWAGSAAALIEGPRRLDDLRWRLRPASLMALSPSVELDADLPSGRGEGEVEITDGETITLRDVRARTDIATVLRWIERDALQALLRGRIELIMTEGVVSAGLLQRGDGLLTLEDARIGPGGRFPLGTLALRLQPEADGTRGLVTSPEGPFEVDGTLDLRGDGEFHLRVSVSPRAGEAEEARRVATSLGFANPGGTTVFEASGNVDGRNLQLDQRAGG